MKLLAIFVLGLCLQSNAKVFSQTDTRISLDIRKVSMVSALSAIEKQSGFRIIFSEDDLPVSNEKFNVIARNELLSKVLKDILVNTPLEFRILDSKVVIISLPGERQETEQPELPQFTVTGEVTDPQGNALVGVSINIKNSQIGTTTAESGLFSIVVPDNSSKILVFSMVGYKPREVKVSQAQRLSITLELQSEGLNEVVVVGYGSQRKFSTTAAVSQVKGSEITKAPVSNISNTLAGRASGVLAFQSSGQPGEDASSLRIRGIATTGNANALTIVDGIPRNINQINPEEIESISVLKDAAAIAPYGLAGANGVILITTKRGRAGQMNVNYNGFYGFQQPTRYPKYLDSYGFATLLNEANENYGFSPSYTEEQLQKFRDGSDPDRYPNTDWLREVVNFRAPMMRHDLSLSGGSDKVRFFTALGYFTQEGAVDVINYSRVNLAANLDVKATNTTTFSLDIKGSYELTENPGSSSGTQIFTSVTKNPPLLPNTLRFSNGLPGNVLLPSIYESGYNNEHDNTLFTQLSIEQKLPFIPGLSLKGVAAFDKSYGFNKVWQKPYSYYALNADEEFDELAGGVPSPTLSEQFNQSSILTLQGYITYQQKFGDHSVNALAVAEKRSGNHNNFGASRLNYAVFLDELSMGSTDKNNLDNNGASSANKQLGVVYRLGYNFREKYLFEFAGRYDGHYYFAPGNRYAFFPAVSLGWRLSEEAFIRDHYPWINNLKIRTSLGKSGNLAGNAFQYLSAYGINNSYVFGGSQFTQVQGIYELNEPNPNITWETARKFDVGIEGNFWNGKLNVEFDVFKEKRSDMLLTPNETIPAEYGIGLSQVNAGIMASRGFDLMVGTAQQIGKDFRLDANFTFTYAENELLQTFENASTYNNPNRRTTGRPLNTRFGYQAIGYFQSQKDIDTSAKQFGNVIPGEIKYADLNGDGKITPDDITVIGRPIFPGIIYGLNTNLSWKGFDLSMLWQGAGKTDIYLTHEAQLPFFNGAKVFEEQLDTWRPDNPNAAYPVVSPTPTTNNTQTSSFWVRDGSYLRLKTLQFGYNLPASVLNAINFKTLRIYVSGQNLLTFSGEKYLDPELSSTRARYYFQQKVFSFGLNAGL